MLTSRDYRRNAPCESDEWATSDRGWLYDPDHPDRDRSYNGNLPVGNYLDYGPCGEHHREMPEGAVHLPSDCGELASDHGRGQGVD